MRSTGGSIALRRKRSSRLAAGQKLWSSRYGKLTSIRLIPKDGGDRRNRDAITTNTTCAPRSTPSQMGLAVQSVKEQSLQASRGATDFGQYFTYFSLFLVVSALLLTTLFFKLGVEQRLSEIGLLRAIGFSIQTDPLAVFARRPGACGDRQPRRGDWGNRLRRADDVRVAHLVGRGGWNNAA